jgi:hypothetical protein
LWASILYLNHCPSSPTIVFDQALSPDGQSWVPPKPRRGWSLEATPNQYVVFRGNLLHGVVADEAAASADGPGPTQPHSPLRLTLLVNYWDRRPMPPNCRDYDGSIYPAILNERVDTPAPPVLRRPAA